MKSNQRGSATLLSVLLIGGMLILVGSINVRVKTQYQLSRVGEQTASTSHLLKAGIEMFVSNLNKLMEQVENDLVNIIIAEEEKSIWWIKLKAIQLAYVVITNEYFYKTPGQFYNYRIKSIRYKVRTGGLKKDYSTEIYIIPYINARGFGESTLNKDLIDHQLLEELDNLDEYSEEELEDLYTRICITQDRKRDREAIQIKVSVTTRDEKNMVYSTETLVARIGFNEIDNNLEISTKINSLKTENK